MSDFLAIGAVSNALKTLLKDRLELPTGVPTVAFTLRTPESDRSTTGEEEPRVNLFLYRVTENGFLKNQEIPGRGDPGSFGRPPLSLDLYYLLTTYGTSMDPADNAINELPAQQLLGSAMRVFHDTGVITPDMTSRSGTPILDRTLRGEFERIKLYLDPISLDEVSKVWTALNLPFRVSAAYKVTVVQIESKIARPFPKLVQEPEPGGPRVSVIPFRTPQVVEVRVRRAADPPGTERRFPYAQIGDTLILLGRNLSSERTSINVGDLNVPLASPPARDDRLEIVIPNDPKLQPGPQTIQVVHDVMLGEPPQPHAGFQSNLGMVMLVPKVTGSNPPAGPPGTTLIVQGERLYSEGLVTVVIVGDSPFIARNPSGPPVQTPTQVQVQVTGLAPRPGPYRVVVRVNGAESFEERTFQVT